MTNPKEFLTQIIQNFAQNDLLTQSLKFFNALGYISERRIEESGSPETFLENYDAQQRFNKERGLFAEWQEVYLLFQLTDDEIKPIKPAFQAVTQPIDNSIIESFLFVALELKQTRYSRTDLAQMTRAINQIFAMPAILLFKHGETLTLSVIHRRLHQRDGSRDVLEKVTLIKEIAIAHLHRAHLDILQQLMLSDLQVSNFVKLYQKWQEVLDISLLNKQFYQELAVLFTQLVGGERQRNTYPTSLKLPSIADDKVLKEFAMRLIGRLLFCWFLQKKTSKKGISLISSEILSSKSVKEHFYHETLEPLFFEVLNKELAQRKPVLQKGDWQQVPFLNGGLFEPHVHDFYDGNCTLNTLIVPADWLAKLLRFFERYHFTIEENTPMDVQVAIDPEMLGQIFENLLAEINPETGETARKATGSYYTPREIVDYMVDEALIAYFENIFHRSANPDRSANLDLHSSGICKPRFALLLSYDNSLNPFNTEETQLIIQAIQQLKIFDPACGSGAFPMGVLQKLTLMLQRLDPNCEQWLKNLLENIPDAMARQFMQEKLQGEKELWNYTRKLGILRECIYGVDIQPIAVEISRLRCFLALIVDEKVEEDKPNRGIIPLPNLDFKFVCANTLKGLPQKGRDETVSQVEFFEESTDDKDLERLREEYFTVQNAQQKQTIQQKFENVQKKMFERFLNWNQNIKGVKGSQAQQLFSWKPFSDESCLWFDPFWMFGVTPPSPPLARGGTGGFDVVLGNPPYIRQEAIKHLKPDLKSYQVFTGTSDLYTYFYEAGFNFLKEQGVLAFITSNKWMRTKYGEKLREFFLTRTTLLQLIDFKGKAVFDATVDANILLFRKGTDKLCLTLPEKGSSPEEESSSLPENKSSSFRRKSESTSCMDSRLRGNDARSVLWVGEDLPTVEKPLQSLAQSCLNKKAFVLGDEKVQALKAKIEAIGTPLKEWDVKIYRGVLTGFNEAFIINTAKKEQLCQEDPKSSEIIKPILRGRDIKRYGYEWAGLWIIATFPSLKINIDDYPAIKSYLESFGKRLHQTGESGCRKKTGNQWFETQDQIAYWQEFEREKVVYPDIAERLCFSFNENSSFLSNTAYFFTGERLKYLLSILNSSLINWYYQSISAQLGEKGIRHFSIYVEQIPIPKISTDQQRPFIELVDKILAAKKAGEDTSAWERKIDQLVYRLYDLTGEEIVVVEGKA